MSRHDQAQTQTWLGGIPMAKTNGRVGLGQLDGRGRWQGLKIHDKALHASVQMTCSSYCELRS